MQIDYIKKIKFQLSLLLLISPVLLLTLKHWTNSVVIILFIGCLYILVTKNEVKTLASFSKFTRQKICLMLAAPFIAIVLSQLLKLDFYTPNWDGPLRLVLCIPIFIVMANGSLRTNSLNSISQIWITLIIPLTLLWTFLYRLIWPTNWGPFHLTTYFVDPLTFGSYTLLFSLVTLIGLSEYWSKSGIATRWLCALAILAGIYLSVTSGSRTGWFNLPFFLCIWAYWVLRPKIGVKRTILAISVFLAFLFGAILSDGYLLNKFYLVWTEISNYKLNDMNEDTSVGLRLSFYRMGLTYILERPFTGWGDLGWMTQMNQLDLMHFASDIARESPKHGFHNEIITNTVRSGIWGLIASVSLYVIVFVRAIQGLRLKSIGEHRLISLTLLVFISHLFIAGLTTEITNLVFLCSFIGLTLAVLLGEQIYLEEKLSLHAKI